MRAILPLLLLALVGCLVLGLASGGTAGAASGPTTVSANVLSATTLDLTGCPVANVELGAVVVSSTTVTPGDCTVGFGSSNDTAALQVAQLDHQGTAMQRIATSFTPVQGAISWRGLTRLSGGRLVAVGVGALSSDPSPIATSDDDGLSWTTRTPGTTSSLRDVVPANATTLFTVGTGGIVRRSTDSGVTWGVLTSGTTQSLYGVTAVGTSNAWAVGANGTIIHWDGTSWSPQVSGTAATLNGVDSVDGTTAWAVGYVSSSTAPVVLKTTDAGATWNPASVPAGLGTLYDVDMVSASTIWMTGSYGTLITTDGGTTWTKRASKGVAVEGTSATTAVLAYSASSGQTGRTTDGGSTFTMVPTGTGPMRRVLPTTGSNEVAVGDGDAKLHSTDDGATWTVIGIAYPSLRGVATIAPNIALQVGSNGAARRSIDTGTTWVDVAVPTTNTLRDVDAASDGSLTVAVGNGGTIITSADGGSTWSSRTSGTGQTLTSAWVRDAREAWVVGGAGVVLHSVDAGVTWSAVAVPTGQNLDAIDGSGATIVAVGAAGTLLRSADAGATWSLPTSGTTVELWSVSVAAPNVAWVGGDPPTAATNGVLLRSVDTAATWSPVAFNNPSPIYGLRALDENSAFTVGSVARLTSDGGATWTTVALNVSTPMDAVDGFDGHELIAAGDSYSALRLPSSTSVPDYVAGSADFSSAGGAFGTCLRTVGSATAVWGTAGATCTPGTTAFWHALPTTPTTIATTATSVTTGTAALRFGLRTTASQSVGAYAAGVELTVIAPAA